MLMVKEKYIDDDDDDDDDTASADVDIKKTLCDELAQEFKFIG